jgi:hypothetical protein
MPCQSWFGISASCVDSRHRHPPSPPATPAAHSARAGRSGRLSNFRGVGHRVLYWSRSRRMGSVSCARPGLAWLQPETVASDCRRCRDGILHT